MKKNQYTTDETLNIVRTFLSSGLTKWEFTKLHPEYKSSTLFGWLVQYSKQLENATGSSDSSPVSTSDLDTTTKFNCVIDTAKMNELEVGKNSQPDLAIVLYTNDAETAWNAMRLATYSQAKRDSVV